MGFKMPSIPSVSIPSVNIPKPKIDIPSVNVGDIGSKVKEAVSGSDVDIKGLKDKAINGASTLVAKAKSVGIDIPDVNSMIDNAGIPNLSELQNEIEIPDINEYIEKPDFDIPDFT